MADRKHQRDVLVEKRARALALMLLTRRPDLLIEEMDRQAGLDYVVRFQSRGKPGLREFGVHVQGDWPTATQGQADDRLRPVLRQLKPLGPFKQPVCLFLFTMENDAAWYAWVSEPVHLEEGRPMLRLRDAADSRPLDKKALKEIVTRVDAWYDAFFPMVTMNGPSGERASRQAK